MRLFVAVDPGERFRSALAPWLDALRSETGLKWVRLDQVHITLRFLGERPHEQVPALAEALRIAVADVPAFEVGAGAPDVFPARGRARVSFLHMHSDGALAELAGRVFAAVAACGQDAAPETGSFRAHLTLGRVRRGAGDLGSALRALPRPDLPAFRVGQVGLIRSELGRSGPIYTALELFPLAEPQSTM